ncbi:MAG: hypothetical protein A3J38_08220 [Gammaproteobacteria bacterium RIFCSPHIGHO2_12_FULL_45_9]|nr:MAG: hypothetical protein A3J38_08220 [Gammaproteobacteria bacterium RIFCSPHIGHO2_12_FULL_45_9]
MRERVVLLHGLDRDPASLLLLAQALERAHFDVMNLGYPSRAFPIEGLVGPLMQQAQTWLEDDVPLHFVGHSLGGILIRAWLGRRRPRQLGRVVQLASANQGTVLVDWLRYLPGFTAYYGPAVLQLGTRSESCVLTLPAVDYELGILAGNQPALNDWFFSQVILREPNDGKITVASTRVSGMKAHGVLPVAHREMPSESSVIEQVVSFLQTGHFHASHVID